MNANDKQVGGTHYKEKKIQPWDVVQDWNLGFLDGVALKYISRWRQKGGVEDLKKAIHYLEKQLRLEITGAELSSSNEEFKKSFPDFTAKKDPRSFPDTRTEFNSDGSIG